MAIRPWFAGLIFGISAAAAQAFFRIQPPVAYAICLTCHPAEIVKWLMNNFWGTQLPIHQAFVLFPSLLVIGVVVGSFIAGHINEEVAWHPIQVEKKFMAALFGFLVAVFGLAVGACPVRVGLLVSYGSVTFGIVLASVISGVGLASVYLRLRKER